MEAFSVLCWVFSMYFTLSNNPKSDVCPCLSHCHLWNINHRVMQKKLSNITNWVLAIKKSTNSTQFTNQKPSFCANGKWNFHLWMEENQFFLIGDWEYKQKKKKHNSVLFVSSVWNNRTNTYSICLFRKQKTLDDDDDALWEEQRDFLFEFYTSVHQHQHHKKCHLMHENVMKSMLWWMKKTNCYI